MRPEVAAERGLGDMPHRVHPVTSLGSSRSPCITLPVSDPRLVVDHGGMVP